MAITGPKGAHPTLRGWVNAKGELLKSQRITQAQIDEWYGVEVAQPAPQPAVEAPVAKEVAVVETQQDASPAETLLANASGLTKVKLIEAAAELGIDLDAKKTKAALVVDLEEAVKSL